MKLEGKNILVTGASGLIGSNLSKTIINLYNCSLTTTYHQSPLLYGGTGLHAESGDLLDPSFCDRITKNIDIVFHCAAKSYGAAVMENDPMALVKDNIIMNINMLEASHKNNVKKFIWLASTTGYPETTEYVTEGMMFQGEPFDKYYAVGWVKRYSEVLCKLFSEKLKKKLQCIVLRPTNIYGPGDKLDPKKSHVLSALMRKIIEKQNPIQVWGDGKDVKDVLYVDDMVRAMILASEKIDTFEQFNIGYYETFTVMEILEKIKKIAGYDAPIEFIPTGPTMIPVRRVDIEKAGRILGWKPQVKIDEGIARMYSWMSKVISSENK